MRTFFILILSFFIFSSQGHAQLFDSIRTSFDYKPKFLLKFDTRNSFISNQYAKIHGVKVGLSFNKTTNIGIGYHWMPKRSLEPTLLNSNKIDLKFGYAVAFFEYNFYKSKHWSAEIPVQIGLGKAQYDDVTPPITTVSSWIIIYEPAMTIEYKFLRYFGIGGGVGFRLAIKSNKQIKESFTAPEYILRFKIYFGDIYKEQILKE
ncbi:hypothetical protein OAL26_03395 [Flavobacteriales bacterium]|nr:hypothetical protein [Flavobacteriales bacterium]